MIYTLDKVAESAFLSRDLDVSFLIDGDYTFKMTHVPGAPDQLRFILTDNEKIRVAFTIKPDLQRTGEIHLSEDRSSPMYVTINFTFPYINIHTPKKLIATSQTLFKVLEYTEVPESNSKKPDIEGIKNVIYNAIEELGLKLKPRGL